jgi:hypothetical protein
MARPPTSRVPAAINPAGSISGRLWADLQGRDLAKAGVVSIIIAANASIDRTEDKEKNLDPMVHFLFIIKSRCPIYPHGQYRVGLGKQ